MDADITTPYAELAEALFSLLAVCDGARARDDVGFNATDAGPARWYALTVGSWDESTARAVHQMLVKYRGQLGGAVPAPVPATPRPISVPRGAWPAEIVAVSSDFAKVRLWREAKGIRDDLKGCPGRRWDPDSKMWVVPLSPEFHAWAERNHVAWPEGYEPPKPKPNLYQAEGDWHFQGHREDYSLAALRACPGRRWDPDRRIWILPARASSVPTVRRLAELGWTIDPEIDAEIAEIEKAEAEEAERKVDWDSMDFGFELKAHQRVPEVERIVKQRRGLIADEMGLGKTVTSLAVAKAADVKRLVVVCPAAVKSGDAWPGHIEKAYGVSPVILHGRTAAPIPDDAQVVILNFSIAAAHADAIKAWDPDGLIIDEAHQVKNPKAQQTRAVSALARSVREKDGLVLCLTGTPVLSRPAELISPLQMLGVLGRSDLPFGTWEHFVRRYCGGYQKTVRGSFVWDISGCTHAEELNQLLTETVMLRRRITEQVELPPLTTEDVWVPLPPEIAEEYEIAYDDLVNYLAEKASRIAEEIGADPGSAAVAARIKAQAAEELVRLNTLLGIVARGKVDAAATLAEQMIDEGHKVLVFAHHKEGALHVLAERLGALLLDGDTTERERVELRQRFENDPDARAFVISIRAGGVGITLTSADRVIIAEQPWTPGEVDQAIARAYRIGQTKPVHAVHVLASGTVDDKVHHLLAEKRAIADQIVDGADKPAGVTQTKSVAGDLLVEILRSRRAQAANAQAS